MHLDFVNKADSLVGKPDEIYEDYENLMLLDSENNVIMWILIAISLVNVLSVSRLVFMGKARECAIKRCNGATGMNILADVMTYVLKMSMLSLITAVVFSYTISKILLDNASLKSIIPALILTLVTAFVVVVVNFRKISRNKALNMLRISEE